MLTATAARKAGPMGTIVCLAPDVCKTSVGTAVVPVPYMIVSTLDWAAQTAPRVQFRQQEAFTMASRTNQVTGDEPGALGGVKSAVNRGWCRPVSHQSNVQIEGQPLIHSGHLYEMNCAGPEGAGNTMGMLAFLEQPIAAGGV